MEDYEFITLDASTAVRDGDYIYLFGNSINILYRYSIIRNKTDIISMIPQKKLFDKELVGKILKWQTDLILIPFVGKSIWIFHLASNTWDEIVLKETSGILMISMQGHIYNGVLHMIGCNYPYIVRVNLGDYSVEYDSRVYDEIRKIIGTPSDSYFRSEYIKKGNEIITGCLVLNKILHYNLETQEFFLETPSVHIDTIEGVAEFKGMRVLASRKKGEVFVSNEGTWDKVINHNQLPFVYLATVLIQKEMVFLSKMVGTSVVYKSKNTLEVDNYKAFIFCDKEDSGYIAMDIEGNLLIEDYDKETIIKTKCQVKKSVWFFDKVKNEFNNSFIGENKFMGIRELIEVVADA